MQIHNLTTGVDITYSNPEFITILESYLTHFRTSEQVRIVQVNKHQNYKYEGDLYGLLDDLHIDKKFHHLVARINGYEHSGDFKGDVDYLVLPDFSEVEQIKSIYLTSIE